MLSVWDSVYGDGFYVAHVLGARSHSRAEITGSKNTVLEVELYQINGDTSAAPDVGICGVAKDDKGDIYKLVLQ
jgi:hypothetical protein